MAKTVQAEARKHYNFNIVESYALWMTGAWLEGAVRQSVKARAVHIHLEGMAKDLLTDQELVEELRRRG